MTCVGDALIQRQEKHIRYKIKREIFKINIKTLYCTPNPQNMHTSINNNQHNLHRIESFKKYNKN